MRFEKLNRSQNNLLNQRRIELRRTTKFLASDIPIIRERWKQFKGCLSKFARDEKQRFANENLHISNNIIKDIIRGEVWNHIK